MVETSKNDILDVDNGGRKERTRGNILATSGERENQNRYSEHRGDTSMAFIHNSKGKTRLIKIEDLRYPRVESLIMGADAEKMETLRVNPCKKQGGRICSQGNGGSKLVYSRCQSKFFQCDGDRDIEKGKSVIRNSPSKYEGQVGISKVDKVISEAGFDWQASGEVTNIRGEKETKDDR